MITTGQIAPDFTLPRDGGSSLTLSALRHLRTPDSQMASADEPKEAAAESAAKEADEAGRKLRLAREDAQEAEIGISWKHSRSISTSSIGGAGSVGVSSQ